MPSKAIAGAQRVAMRVQDGTQGTDRKYFLLSDHLGSASLVVDANGQAVVSRRYYPWGETRYSSGSMPTDRLYTGQVEEAELGLYHYVARMFDPYISIVSRTRNQKYSPVNGSIVLDMETTGLYGEVRL